MFLNPCRCDFSQIIPYVLKKINRKIQILCLIQVVFQKNKKLLKTLANKMKIVYHYNV